MELRQLNYFLAVADARSFVSAANSLYISRQAVSKAVGQLEQELGVDLFVRDSNGAFLTPAGLMFYDRIRSSVKELEQVRTEMQRYGSRFHQRVRLVFSTGIMPLYEEALLQFRQVQENVELEYQEYPEKSCLDRLLEHKADLAICTEMQLSQEFVAHTLVHSPYGVLLKRTEALETVDSLELQDLSWLPMAGLADSSTRSFMDRHSLHLQYAGLDLYRLFLLTRNGRCAMLLPRCMVPNSMADLIWLPLDQTEQWSLQAIRLRSLENNVLYSTTIDELQSSVFASVAQM